MDLINLKAIHSKFGKLKLRKLPRLGLFERYFYDAVCGIQTVNLLDLISYRKQQAKDEVAAELNWTDYGGKHHESIFTRFYQGYYLPVKFNIDKRKAHESNLILSGQTTREEALKELQSPPYPHKLQMTDRDYVVKKLGFSQAEWEQIMNAPRVDHEFFDTEQKPSHQLLYLLFRVLMFLPVRILRAVSILHKQKKIGSRW